MFGILKIANQIHHNQALFCLSYISRYFFSLFKICEKKVELRREARLRMFTLKIITLKATKIKERESESVFKCIHHFYFFH